MIIDAYTKQLMGWELSIIKDSQAAISASKMALETASKTPIFYARKLIMHTDQGSAYIASDYIRYWRTLGVTLSTADKGKPTQNPYIEAFFSILSRFWLKYHEFLTIYDAKEKLLDFFNRYNQEWPHGALNNLSPSQKLQEYLDAQKEKQNRSLAAPT